MTFEEAVTHAQVATSRGCHTDDQHCMRVLGNEAQRLRSLFGSFQLECCDDWTCAEEHSRRAAAALHEARSEVELLRAVQREQQSEIDELKTKPSQVDENVGLRAENLLLAMANADREKLKAEHTELREAIAEYFVRPSGEKKRAIRLKFSLPILCDHDGIGRPGCPVCDPRRPKPGAGT